MPELMTALYHSRSICVFDLLDQNGQYVEEVRSEYRKASQANELVCPECQGTLELCAGVIVAPYFRHKSINDCPISRELKTAAGKRMYHGKKMLYALGKTANPNNIVMEEGKNSLPYQPILLKVNDQEGALLYLDGKSRNYEELRQAQQFYEARQMKTHWFLHKKYQTNSRNLTSDEAEVARINDDILYYLDTDHGKIDFRKAYQSPYGERIYYTETISLENLMLDDEGEFDRSFLEDYKEHVKKQRQALDCILRLPMEEGLDEIYFSFSYCYMDSIEEIWILPKLQMPLEEAEFNERARKQRENYVEQCNAMLLQVPREEQDELVREILKYVNRRQKVSNWLS